MFYALVKRVDYDVCMAEALDYIKKRLGNVCQLWLLVAIVAFGIQSCQYDWSVQALIGKLCDEAACKTLNQPFLAFVEIEIEICVCNRRVVFTMLYDIFYDCGTIRSNEQLIGEYLKLLP